MSAGQVGEKFRSRALRFPSLVSGCTVDWFQPWPKQALIAVAQHFTGTFSLACEPSVRDQLVQAMGAVQDTVADYCIQFFLRSAPLSSADARPMLPNAYLLLDVTLSEEHLLPNLWHGLSTLPRIY